MYRLKMTTHHGDFYEVQHLAVAGDDFGINPEEIQRALNVECVYPYNVSDARAEELAREIDLNGCAGHGWTTISMDSGEWA